MSTRPRSAPPSRTTSNRVVNYNRNAVQKLMCEVRPVIDELLRKRHQASSKRPVSAQHGRWANLSTRYQQLMNKTIQNIRNIGSSSSTNPSNSKIKEARRQFVDEMVNLARRGDLPIENVGSIRAKLPTNQNKRQFNTAMILGTNQKIMTMLRQEKRKLQEEKTKLEQQLVQCKDASLCKVLLRHYLSHVFYMIVIFVLWNMNRNKGYGHSRYPHPT